ncbi:hypothetical protein LINPERPRIM_LOCUS18435 [Linum perenne]
MTSTSSSLLLHFPLFSSTKLHRSNPSNLLSFPSVRKPNHRLKAAAVATGMADEQSGSAVVNPDGPMKLLFVEMGVGYDQHGQDINAAAMRACRDAITSNSIPAFRRGSIPGVSMEQMKLQIKLGVPHSLQHGKILSVDVVDGGLLCSSGVLVEEMGDKNDDCYIVNAAVYIGY